MANITINEISQNYSYNIGNNSYCQVALPITSSWGPGYFDPQKYAEGVDAADLLESVAFQRFPATQAGLESFVSTYRGPTSNYRLAKDFSYQMAMTLLSAGYDVLTCRVAPGDKARVVAYPYEKQWTKRITLKATEIASKYPADGNHNGQHKLSVYYGSGAEDYVSALFNVQGTAGAESDPAVINNSDYQILNPDGSAFTYTFDAAAETHADMVFDVIGPVGFDFPISKIVLGPDTTESSASTYTIQPSYKYAIDDTEGRCISIAAKYPGTFGNSIMVRLAPAKQNGVNLYWNLIVYVVDATGTRTAVENLSFVLNEEKSTDNLPYIAEVQSNFVELVAVGTDDDGADHNYHFEFNAELSAYATLVGGTDGHALAEYIPLEAAVEFKLGTFYAYEDGEYKLLEVSPGDFSENYSNYYVKSKAISVVAPENIAVTLVNTTFLAKVSNNGSYADAYTFKYVGESTWKLGDTSVTLSQYGITVDGVPAINDEIIIQVKSIYLAEAARLATIRYQEAYPGDSAETIQAMAYISAINNLKDSTTDDTTAKVISYREWIFDAAYLVYDMLTDKLAYNNQRVISPGWDDQDLLFVTGEYATGGMNTISPFHIKLMNVAYYSRCAAAYIDIPRSLPRSKVYDEDSPAGGYAQKLSRYEPAVGGYDVNRAFYSTHSGLIAPWGQFKYAGTSKYNIASPAFQALMIERGMILNQPAQYEWALPTNRHHQVSLGKLDYAVSKKYLDQWQKLEGVGVNVITNIPDMGISLWGNSTLYEVPPATYQALANLSTRKLVNAVEDVVYRCGIAITFQYNNAQAYSAFYAGVTPLLDTMKNVGAIDDYYVRMSADIDAEGSVNANTVIGKVYLVINGVINDIVVDLVALPPATDLNQFRA